MFERACLNELREVATLANVVEGKARRPVSRIVKSFVGPARGRVSAGGLTEPEEETMPVLQ